MKFGLKDSDYNFLEKNLIQILKSMGLNVYLFGSRSTGKNHPYSDIDLLVSGKVDEKHRTEIRRIKDFFEESNFPFKIDIVVESDLAEGYRESVHQSKAQL